MKNKYTIEGDIVKIYFKHKKLGEQYAIINLECLDKVLGCDASWFGSLKSNNRCYLVTTLYLGIVDGKPKYRTLYLHRLITGCTYSNQYVDHINHNTLDNTLSNLRVVSNSENLKNIKTANKNSSTGVRNVTYSEKYKKYSVQFFVDGKNKIIGNFLNGK